MDPVSFAALLPLLVEATQRADGSVFGFWSGHNDVRPRQSGGFTQGEFDPARHVLAGRELILLQGDISALADQVTQHPNSVARPPTVMWPRHRSWHVLSDIDFDSTIIGGGSGLW
ncbi:hypothetical protein HT102_03510 [Hoyosella sp. G463]|uniref:Uncharacterized protein n=1 Tax=Lolliginicoccus lacisalsi TaxID=2742202 RepID=A0A927JBV7_9ACTN|nr:hypothetical protein [Lolliginicoccus lacisalsi]MBD8505557.1 hypothetical protein [Lolliginicoccus lacisalsi]